MTDRDERSDRFKERFSSGVSAESTGREKDEQTANTSKSNEEEKVEGSGEDESQDSVEQDEKATESEESIKDRQSVLMYLPDDVWRELDVRFDELNAKHKRQHGEALEKNRDYYPAVIQAGLNDKDIEDILDL